MSVEKFRSIEEMNRAGLRASRAGGQAGEHFDRFVRHCARYWLAAPRVYPRGVFKYRSIHEAPRSSTSSTPPPS